MPDHAEAEIDIRTTPSLRDAGGALALVEQQLEGTELSIIEAHDNPPMEVDADHQHT